MSDLIDREAFIEQERKVYCENCDRRQGMKNGKLTFCYEIGDAPCRACWGEDILTDLEDFPAAPRWVRCEDALPEIGQRVIVYDGWMQFMTRKDDQRLNGKMYWENEEGNWERVDDEAYWMPIEPPKEDA